MSSALSVSDTSSNRREQIANFAEILSGSPLKIKLVELIYRGKKKIKTVEHLAAALRKTPKDILTLASPLATQGLFEKTKVRIGTKSLIAYGKIPFVSANKSAILKMARDKKKLKSYATKSNPHSTIKTTVTVRMFKPGRARHCSLLDFEQFKKGKAIKLSAVKKITDRISEARTKKGISTILGEIHQDKDWGGETADIISARIRVRGKSETVAFALKGPAQTGTLYPGKMGKNGDQIQRLFRAPVRYHFVQYEERIDASVLEQMQQLARAKALMGEDVFYGVVDDVDTRKLRLAFPKAFK